MRFFFLCIKKSWCTINSLRQTHFSSWLNTICPSLTNYFKTNNLVHSFGVSTLTQCPNHTTVGQFDFDSPLRKSRFWFSVASGLHLMETRTVLLGLEVCKTAIRGRRTAYPLWENAPWWRKPELVLAEVPEYLFRKLGYLPLLGVEGVSHSHMFSLLL